VIVLAPAANWLPITDKEAVPTSPDPDNVTVPRSFWPTLKDTDPLGGADPDTALTVAVKRVELPELILVWLEVTVVPVAMGWLPFHSVARLYTSMEPRPLV
jgi:hypothetical protein